MIGAVNASCFTVWQRKLNPAQRDELSHALRGIAAVPNPIVHLLHHTQGFFVAFLAGPRASLTVNSPVIGIVAISA